MKLSLLIFALLIQSAVQSADAADVIDIFVFPIPQLAYSEEGSDQVQGTVVALIAGIFKQARIEASFHLVPRARAVHNARNLNNACIIGYRISPEERNKFKWVGPLMRNPAYVYARQSQMTKVSSAQELRHEKVGIVRGTSTLTELDALGIAPEEAATTMTNVKKLMVGRIDYAIISDLELPLLSEHVLRNELKRLFVVDDREGYLACNLAISDENITRLNQALTHERLAGRLKSLGLAPRK